MAELLIVEDGFSLDADLVAKRRSGNYTADAFLCRYRSFNVESKR